MPTTKDQHSLDVRTNDSRCDLPNHRCSIPNSWRSSKPDFNAWATWILGSVFDPIEARTCVGIDCMAFCRFEHATMDWLERINTCVRLAMRTTFLLLTAVWRAQLVCSMARHVSYLANGFSCISLFVRNALSQILLGHSARAAISRIILRRYGPRIALCRRRRVNSD